MNPYLDLVLHHYLSCLFSHFCHRWMFFFLNFCFSLTSMSVWSLSSSTSINDTSAYHSGRLSSSFLQGFQRGLNLDLCISPYITCFWVISSIYKKIQLPSLYWWLVNLPLYLRLVFFFANQESYPIPFISLWIFSYQYKLKVATTWVLVLYLNQFKYSCSWSFYLSLRSVTWVLLGPLTYTLSKSTDSFCIAFLKYSLFGVFLWKEFCSPT